MQIPHQREASRVAPGATGLILGLLWGGLLWGGFPFPSVDDGYFVGTAVHLATSGVLQNPLLEHREPAFGYPPFYWFLFAGWLKVTGVGNSAVVLFSGLMGGGATWCAVRCLQKMGNELLGWLLAALLIAYFSCTGLRSDSAGLFCLGLSVWLGLSERRVDRALSPFLALLAVGLFQASLALAAPWLIYGLSSEKSGWKPFLISAVVLGALFLLMIQGDLRGFWAGVSQNMGGSRQDQVEWFLGNWSHPMGVMKFIFPVAILLPLVGLAILRRGPRLLDFLTVLSLLLGFYTSWNSVSGQRILMLITLLGIGFYLKPLGVRRPWDAVAQIGCAALLFGFSMRHLVQGLTTEKPSNGAVIRQEVDADKPARLIVDAWSLRYVFHYHLRPGMIFVGYADRPSSHSPNPFRKYPDEAWVMAAEAARTYPLQGPGVLAPKVMMLAGRPMGDWITNAGQLVYLPVGK